MTTIRLEVWLYGPLAEYAGEEKQEGYARLEVEMPAGSTLEDLLHRLKVPGEERGITFVNGALAALPGLDVDLSLPLGDGDRVGIFHRRSMWPFQYRFGAPMTPQLREAFREREDRGIHHAYTADAEVPD